MIIAAAVCLAGRVAAIVLQLAPAAWSRPPLVWGILLLSVAVVFLSLTVLVLELFAPQVARVMAGGFSAELLQTSTDLLRITVSGVRICRDLTHLGDSGKIAHKGH